MSEQKCGIRMGARRPAQKRSMVSARRAARRHDEGDAGVGGERQDGLPQRRIDVQPQVAGLGRLRRTAIHEVDEEPPRDLQLVLFAVARQLDELNSTVAALNKEMADADQVRRALAEARNKGEGLLYSSERALEEFGGLLPEDERAWPEALEMLILSDRGRDDERKYQRRALPEDFRKETSEGYARIYERARGAC